MQCAAAVIPLLLKYQGTGKIHAVIQEDQLYSQLVELGSYTGLVEFGEKLGLVAGTDWRHPRAAWLGMKNGNSKSRLWFSNTGG